MISLMAHYNTVIESGDMIVSPCIPKPRTKSLNPLYVQRSTSFRLNEFTTQLKLSIRVKSHTARTEAQHVDNPKGTGL